MEQIVAKYLANEMAEEERLTFESQLLEDDALQTELKVQLDLLYATEKSEIPFDTTSAWASVEQQIGTKSEKVVHMPRKQKFSFLKIAATLLIVLTAGYFVNDYVSEDSTSIESPLSYQTKGSIQDIKLPDGSSVKLNANSRLLLAEGFGKTNRNLTLIGGANFDVERNESLPFIIEASNSKIEVLGTSFNVDAYAEDVELNVSEGRVKFGSKTNTENEEVFTAGEKAVLKRDGSIVREELKNSNYAAWWTKTLEFDNATFKEVFNDLEKAFHVSIEYDEALANCPYTATLEKRSLDYILGVIKDTYPNITSVDIKDSTVKLEGFACKD